jgi:hypothetical protein
MATLTDSIVSYTRAEIVGSLVLALVVACLVVGTVRRTGWAAVRGPAATLAAAAFAVLIYIAAPDQVGQFADINARLGLYAVLFLLLWLARNPSEGERHGPVASPRW